MATENDDSIKVSSQRIPISYQDVIQERLSSHETAELSGLGSAVASVVRVVEHLKKENVVVVESINTSLVHNKPKMNVVLKRGTNFDNTFKVRQQLKKEREEIKKLENEAQAKLQEKLKAQASKK